MITVRLQSVTGAVFIIFNIGQVLSVEPMQVVVPGDPTGSQLTNRVESKLCVIKCVIHALDIGSDVMWCTSDQLCLEGEPVDRDLRSVGVLVVFFHHYMSRTKPSGITPEPNTLPQTVFRIGSFVLHL